MAGVVHGLLKLALRRPWVVHGRGDETEEDAVVSQSLQQRGDDCPATIENYTERPPSLCIRDTMKDEAGE